LIARISKISGVEVFHLGAWPADVDAGQVRLLGTLISGQMADHMSKCHYFLHTAIKDPCPNSIFEAVCGGLPVIYNPGLGSSAEILKWCGLALDVEHPEATLSLARLRLAEMRDRVMADRDRFSISHAAGRYRAMFERAAHQCAGRVRDPGAVIGTPQK
jgi:hypothetical protein